MAAGLLPPRPRHRARARRPAHRAGHRVIDWSDAAIVDPAYDFGLLHRDLGAAALHAALRSYRTEVGDVASVRDRAVFYARCTVFGDLAYGLEAVNAAYAEKSVAALDWLFES